MKIEEFWNYAAYRYSFNSIIGVALLIVIIAILCILYIFTPHPGGESRTSVFLYLITGFPSVTVPLLILSAIYTFEFLYKKENKNENFRIKNHLLTNIYAKKYTFAIPFMLSIFLLLFSIIFTTWILFQPYSIGLRIYFLLITIPSSIFITFIYLFVRKKFLHDQSSIKSKHIHKHSNYKRII